MTDTVKPLSDDALREIERVIKSSPCATFPMTTEEVRSLCATVRAENERLRGWQEGLAATTIAWSEEHVTQTTENTALREQLDQARIENERLASQLKEWQEEKDTKAGYL